MIQRASEYSIRALTFLAQQSEGSFQLARDMAERLGIPAPYLAKILQPLVSHGLIESQRGRRGGFRLLRSATEIRLYEIVDAQEQLGRVRHCLLGQAECTDERACPLHQYWMPASEEFLRVLSETRLSDMTSFCEESPGCGYPCPPALGGSGPPASLGESDSGLLGRS